MHKLPAWSSLVARIRVDDCVFSLSFLIFVINLIYALENQGMRSQCGFCLHELELTKY